MPAGRVQARGGRDVGQISRVHLAYISPTSPVYLAPGRSTPITSSASQAWGGLGVGVRSWGWGEGLGLGLGDGVAVAVRDGVRVSWCVGGLARQRAVDGEDQVDETFPHLLGVGDGARGRGSGSGLGRGRGDPPVLTMMLCYCYDY